MADLIVVCGPHAVGKMTVAESLRDKLRYNMMMNHDSIEVSDRIFGFATPAQKEFNETGLPKPCSLPQSPGTSLQATVHRPSHEARPLSGSWFLHQLEATFVLIHPAQMPKAGDSLGTPWGVLKGMAFLGILVL